MRVCVAVLLFLVPALAGCTELEKLRDTLRPPTVDVPHYGNGTAAVYVVDVGQGDGTLWVLPDGGVVVYDCGPAVASVVDSPLVALLRGLGHPEGDTLQVLVASHGHLDHIGGCDEVLDSYRFRHVYETWYTGDDRPRSYERFQEKVLQEVDEGAVLHTLEPSGVPGAVTFAAGMDLELGTDDAYAEILWPPAVQVARWDDIAEDSIVVRLGVGENAMCFQGDIEAQQERAILDSVPAVDCEVHLVGHHGSRYANSPEWLAAMDPEHAVVSYGENSYGHPTWEAMCQHEQAGAALYETHEQGTITVALSVDGVELTPDPVQKTYC